MLRVTLVGNMGGDPELKYSQKGTAIASFSVAVNQVRRGLTASGRKTPSGSAFACRASRPSSFSG